MLCFVHRVSFIHTAVTNLDSKSIQASVPVGPDAKIKIICQYIYINLVSSGVENTVSKYDGSQGQNRKSADSDSFIGWKQGLSWGEKLMKRGLWSKLVSMIWGNKWGIVSPFK